MTGERRYSRDEAEHVLRRASDGEHVEDTGGGLTLDELVAAAREAGIDPTAVRLAAAISPARADPVQRLLVGAPVNPTVRARFPGRLGTERAGELAALMDERLDLSGEVAAEGGLLVWTEDHGFGRTVVTARPDGAAVEVSATAERQGHLLGLVFAILIVLALLFVPLGGIGGAAAALGSLGAVVGPMAVTLIATRLLWPVLQRSTVRRLEAAVLGVGTLVAESPAPALPGGIESQGQLSPGRSEES